MRFVSPLFLVLVAALPCGLFAYNTDPEIDPQLDNMFNRFKADAWKLGSDEKSKAPAKLPHDFRPWWASTLHAPIGDGKEAIRISLEDLYANAIRNSSQIKVFSDIPLIRETGIQEAKGAFDTRYFIEGKFDRQDDPVGNTLTAGDNQATFEQDDYSLESGFRKKLITGADATLSEKVGRTDSNSIFMAPNPQATGKLKFSVTQPILKTGGTAYNSSIIRIAKLDTAIAQSEFVRQTETHLFEIARSYWGLYMARSLYLQKHKLVNETKAVLEELEARKDFDANRAQLFRARSALSSRQADLVRAEMGVRNSQDRIRALVNDPDMADKRNLQLSPSDMLIFSAPSADAQNCAMVALEQRPEITQAIKQLRSAAIRNKMQKNELLPQLNLFFETYVAGLREDTEICGAVDRQLRIADPGYAAGFLFEYPLENNVAEARSLRRRIELRQQFQQLSTTVQTVLLEVKVAVREVNTAWKELQAKYESMASAKEELEDLRARRDLKTTANMETSAYIEFYLDSQDRETKAEEAFLQSMTTYQVSLISLQRSQGILLRYEDIDVKKKYDEDDLPRHELEMKRKGAVASPSKPLEKASSTKTKDAPATANKTSKTEEGVSVIIKPDHSQKHDSEHAVEPAQKPLVTPEKQEKKDAPAQPVPAAPEAKSSTSLPPQKTIKTAQTKAAPFAPVGLSD